MTPVTRKAGRSAAIGIGILGMCAAPTQAADTGWPASVSARYKLFFGGFEVGNYQFQSQFDGKAYSASSNAEVSALFGAFKWKGSIASGGAIVASGPKPQTYQMSFKAKKKTGSVTLGFDKSGVKTVALVPAKPPHPEAVPLKPEHLAGVIDPMTTILAMTHATSANPCDKKIAVFDGKARFDLVMSYKGQEKIADKTPSGQPGLMTVCKVKYVPVAGHKPKDFVNPWVDYSGIEIALRPVPKAHVYVPYRISIPTTLGAAVMSAESVNITAPDKAQIALTQER
jgi:Protein of unknown function (DUF3108)